MKIPPGHTEESVLAAIAKATAILSQSFVFGCYSAEDISQECHVFAIEALAKDKYNPELPLENFLYTHIRNRVTNLRRDRYRRNDYPCSSCHNSTPCADAVGGMCPKYRAWWERNQRKANIASPLALDKVRDDSGRLGGESHVEEEAEIRELLDRIDAELPVDLRQTYLQMRAGVSVPKSKRLLVESAVKDILKEVIGSCPSEDD